MKLRQYLDQECMSATDFARKAGISLAGVYNYLKGLSKPMRHIAMKIVKATNGDVTLADLGYKD